MADLSYSEDEFESASSGNQAVNEDENNQSRQREFSTSSLFVLILCFLFYVYVLLSLFIFLIYPGSVGPIIDHPVFVGNNSNNNSNSSADTDNAESIYIAKVLLYNSALLLLFLLQHSFFPNHFMLQYLRQINMSAFSRAVYVFGTCITLQFIAYFWTPILPQYNLWSCSYSSSLFYIILITLHTLCWISLGFSIFTFDYLELFGIKQIYYGYYGVPDPILFKSPDNHDLLNHMRHPIFIAPMVILWGVPFMSFNRLLVAVMMPAYMLWCSRVTDEDCLYVQDMFKKKKRFLLEGKTD